MTNTTSACQRIIDSSSPATRSRTHPVDDGGNPHGNKDPQELVPDEEREPPQLGLQARVEGRVEQPYVGEEQEKEPPLAPPALVILTLGFPALRVLVGVHSPTLSPSGSPLPMLLSEQSSLSRRRSNN